MNTTLLNEDHAYLMYDVLESNKRDLERQSELTDADRLTLSQLVSQMADIENFALRKVSERPILTKEKIFQNYGVRPTLTIDFYPGTDSCKRLGRSIVVNVKYEKAELVEIFTAIQNKQPEKAGILNFEIITPNNPDWKMASALTADIYKLG